MKALFTILVVWMMPAALLAQQLCIDHVITVHPNLDTAVEAYSMKGFTLKKGRLHTNGLMNAHIKFANGSSYELMSVQGTPGDEMAQSYQHLLDSGVQGAYLALTGVGLEQLKSVLSRQGVAYEVHPGDLWTYVTFPPVSELAHLFFIIYHREFPADPRFTTHQNGFDHIRGVTIEGSVRVVTLFRELGSIEKDVKDDEFTRFDTPTGEIVMQHPSVIHRRPKLMKVVFGDSLGKSLTVHFTDN